MEWVCQIFVPRRKHLFSHDEDGPVEKVLDLLMGACAKPRLQKPCGGQPLRRRQGGTFEKLDSDVVNLFKRSDFMDDENDP